MRTWATSVLLNTSIDKSSIHSLSIECLRVPDAVLGPRDAAANTADKNLHSSGPSVLEGEDRQQKKRKKQGKCNL